MKICIVTTAFPRWKNDSRAPFIFEAAKAIKNLDNKVTVIASHSPGAKTNEVIDDIKIIRPKYLPEPLENLHNEPGGIPEAWEKQRFTFISLLFFIITQFFAVLKQAKDCDIFHANWTIAGFNTMLVHFLTKKPYVITVQGSDIFKATKFPFIKTITRAILKNSKYVITLSNSLKQEVLKLGCLEEKIQVIPNGVNTSFFFKDDEILREPTIIYIGSLITRKGVKYLLEAMPKIIQYSGSIKLLIVGEGNDHKSLLDLTTKLNINNHVLFLGQISQEKAKELLQKSKVLVLPSIEEGQGVVLIEALACGTPCVGSNVGGIPDVITEKVGTLFDPMNIDEIADSIVPYFTNNNFWEIKSKNARERAIEVYEWNKIGNKIMMLYKD